MSVRFIEKLGITTACGIENKSSGGSVTVARSMRWPSLQWSCSFTPTGLSAVRSASDAMAGGCHDCAF